MISLETIDYSNYTDVLVHNINKYSLYEWFHGILFYIFFYSENKFNNETEINFQELEIFYLRKVPINSIF